MIYTNDTYCVYVHTNKSNGKMYVGQTSQNVEKRWQKGQGYYNSTYFYHAIQKYGWDGFEHEVLASGLTQKEADNFEQLLIRELDLTNHEKGYNLRSGGANGKLSEAHKKKIGKANSKPIYCVELNKVFESGRQAAKELNLNTSGITSCLNGRYKQTGGYHFRYYEEVN